MIEEIFKVMSEGFQKGAENGTDKRTEEEM